MGVIAKLNALDDKAGIPRAQTRQSWERNARWWWANLVLAVAATIAAVLWDLDGVAFVAVVGAFAAGFFYNERLRLLGRRSRLPGYRRPE